MVASVVALSCILAASARRIRPSELFISISQRSLTKEAPLKGRFFNMDLYCQT
jgi:hypothetical protein